MKDAELGPKGGQGVYGGHQPWTPLIRDRIIRVTEKAFDDFAGGAQLKRMLGL